MPHYSPLAMVIPLFPRSNYRGFFTTGESYCPMYTLCTAVQSRTQHWAAFPELQNLKKKDFVVVDLPKLFCKDILPFLLYLLWQWMHWTHCGTGLSDKSEKVALGGALVSRPLNDLCYWYLYFCDNHLSQHPNNRETGYSNTCTSWTALSPFSIACLTAKLRPQATS